MSHETPEAAGLTLDLLTAGRLAPLAAAFLSGRDEDLLAPLALQRHDELPPAPAGPPPDRRELARALAAANVAYGHPAAEALAKKLADPATRVVVTGQQPGLFGGPLYCLSKAVAAVLWAERLEAAGQPAVAVFWVATEDHDFAEVARAVVAGPEEPLAFDLGEDPQPLAPVGVRSLGERVEAVLAAITGLESDATAAGQRWRDWWGEVGRWYRADSRFGEAFCRLMARMLGQRCPLMLDALLPQLKEAEKPWLRRALERRGQVAAALAAAAARVEARGYSPQVRPQPDASPLFLLDAGHRRRIEWTALDEGAWRLRGSDRAGGIDSLLTCLDDNPIVVSPGALARPAVQDAVLGTTLQVLGPGEISYMAQAAALYPVLEVAPPRSALRPQVLVLTEKEQGWIEEIGITLAELTGDKAALEARLTELAGGDFTQPLRSRLEEDFERLTARVIALDPSLETPWQKTREGALRALENFSGRLAAAMARKDEVRTRRLGRLRAATLPLGGQQERTLSAASFYARYGDEFAARMFDQMGLDPSVLHLLRP